MGKSYIESSLKKFLKRKVKITMGLVVAFLITGTVGFASTGLSSGNIEKPYEKGEYYLKEDAVKITNTKGGAVFDSATITLKEGQSLDLIFSNYNENTTVIKDTHISGLNGKKKGTLNLTNKNTLLGQVLSIGTNEKINISVNELNINGFYGIKQTDGTTNFSANTLNIKSKNNGVNLEDGDFNITDSKNVTITSTGTTYNGFSQIAGNTNISANNLNISGGKTGVSLLNGNFTVNSNEFHIENVNNTKDEKSGGFYQESGMAQILTNNLTINSSSNGIQMLNGTNKIKSQTIDIVSTNGKGIYQKGGEVNISTDILKISGLSFGIHISENGVFKINDSKEVNIVSTNDYGVSTNGTVEICTDNLEIRGSYGGIYTYSGEVKLTAKEKITIANGTIENGKFEKGTGNAIKLGSDSTFSLNKNLDNSDDIIVEIIGDIDTSSKNGFDLDLTNKDSFIDGKIVTGSSSSTNVQSNIGLSNGATWNNTGNSNITNLTLNNGVINNESVKNNISIENLNGKGGTLNIGTEIDENGKATAGKIEIGKVNDNLNLDINYSNVGTDTELSRDEAKELLEDLLVNKDTSHIQIENGNLNGTASLEEGFITEGYEAKFSVDKNGGEIKEIISTGTNSMVEGIRDLATINLLTWRQEMNSLNKRMGELRNSTEEHGVWSRVYTGKIENGSKYDNDYQTYQVGYDKKYSVDNGVMFVGGLVSYTDGETDYALGHGENYSVGAGIYATWLNNDGQFADVVLKQSRLHNKFDVTSKNGKLSQSGDYNNWGTSLSGQYGKRFDLNDKFFLEPSVELTLGRVEDTTYTTSAGVDVHQDTMYSLVGNVGTSVGYKFSDKGNVYARAALVKEFQGDIDTEYEKDGALERTSEDLGDTWAEFGVGVNYRFVENMNVYIDVQKTGEATVDNKWQANLGFRYEF